MHDDLEIEDLNEEELVDEPHLKLNDIYPPYEKTDVDVSGIFLLSKLQLSHLHSEKSTQDLQTGLKEKLNFSLHPKIKILKIKKPILDLKKQQKKPDIILKNYHPPKTPYTLDVLDLENISRQVGPYGDIYKPKYDVKYRVLFFARRIKKKTLRFFSQKNNLVYVGTFLFFIMSLFLYKSFITFKLENTLQNVKNMEIASDTDALKNQISDLKYDFFTLNLALQPVFFINSLLGNTDIENLENIISGGNAILSSAMDGVFLYDSISYNIEQKGWENVYFGDFFRNSLPTLSSITKDFSKGVESLEKVQFATDDPLKNTFETNIKKLQKINTGLQTFVSEYEVFESLLGNEKKKKYMIIFQNDDEIRPTGGFMGSVMFVEIFRGKILSYEKKDIYALEWPLKPFKQIAPEGIHKITPTYGLRDANYYLEEGKSAQEIQKFLKKSKVEIDGIVFINQNVITDVLAQTQGVYFEPLKTSVTSENFSWMFSTLVESKVFKEGTLGTPKQILFDFVPVFLTHIKEHSQKSLVAKSIVSSLEKRDILFWSFDEKQNTYLNNLALFPQAPKYEEYLDYAYPYFTSISGNKSDRYIKRKFTKSYSLDQNCTINSKMTVSSEHLFGVNDEINIKNFLYDMDLLGRVELAKTLFIQGKGENRQYVRMYVPKNAIVKESENYKVKQLKDRKEVSFYLNTPLNTTRQMSINYQLPNPECQKYNFQFFKQPGLGSYEIEIFKDENLVEQKLQEYDYFYQEP